MARGTRHAPTLALSLIFCLLSICLRASSGESSEINSADRLKLPYLKCDRTFVSRAGGPQNGTFTAPILVNSAGHSRQCVYTFLAAPNQRAQITFTGFDLRGTPPECAHEYLDVYSEVQQPETSELINSPFGGRFCGPIPPRRRISLYRAIAISFYTDKNITTPELFAGRYSFINDSEYQIGTPAPTSLCSYTIHAEQKRQGNIVSPTYPGSYPKDLTCTYLLLGKPGQRVRLEFRDFDLFYGGPHCPFDVLKIYDGITNDSAVIGTYCGQQRNLVLYSSESTMFIVFETLQRTANTQNRGFKGIFEFSESFVKLDFIGKNDGEHIRGSECDQKILSKKESSGYVFSPNYPFPYMPKIVCRYFIYGMQDSQHLERVRLEFLKFDIPKGEKGDCSDGYLKLYLKGQEATDSYEKFDHELCGKEIKPNIVVSDGPRLVMVFSSGELQGQGFKAKYTFETEYRIPGTAAPDGSCTFTYRSSSRKKGEFNSPRYPSNYPSQTNCTYVFNATPNEQVSLIFDHFRVRADAINGTFGFYGSSICFEDWLEMYNLYRDGTEKLIGRYCGMTAPGPLDSNRGAIGLKVILHTDKEGVYSGFKARYSFDVAKSIFGDCGSNVSSSHYGVIVSPNFPLKYGGPIKGVASKTCNWYINVRPNHKVLLNFEQFAIEGEPNTRGCPAAVVRLWYTLDGPPLELCGEKKDTEKWQYMSESNYIRISFISADKSVGAKGFKAVWTEVADSGENCDEFRCQQSSFCIADKLRCNRVANCGVNDTSDEINCITEVAMEIFWPSVIGVGCSLLLIGLGCLLCRRLRSRRRRPHHLHLPRPPPPTSRQRVCDELGQRFASVDSV
ncbi:cubilin isoform X2 [Cimex lectularius]|uniref:CUB domain-containing protein n=1 Tax=Cimex lectularius TaxID=79782 RepID=A0A8I6SN26_CIMLE|nr:cubilin isoform X2 [Cimex lectularius]